MNSSLQRKPHIKISDVLRHNNTRRLSFFSTILATKTIYRNYQMSLKRNTTTFCDLLDDAKAHLKTIISVFCSNVNIWCVYKLT